VGQRDASDEAMQKKKRKKDVLIGQIAEKWKI
jgi:hypothetical protein